MSSMEILLFLKKTACGVQTRQAVSLLFSDNNQICYCNLAPQSVLFSLVCNLPSKIKIQSNLQTCSLYSPQSAFVWAIFSTIFSFFLLGLQGIWPGASLLRDLHRFTFLEDLFCFSISSICAICPSQLQTKLGLVNVTNWKSLELEAGKEQTLLAGRTVAPRNGWLSLTAALAGWYGMGASPADTAQSWVRRWHLWSAISLKTFPEPHWGRESSLTSLDLTWRRNIASRYAWWWQIPLGRGAG